MATEIERKFLVSNASWDDGSPGTRIAQGYLSTDPGRSVRIRLAAEQAWITIKGRTEGISRPEFEYSIPAEDAQELLSLCLSGIIDKTRYRIPFGGHIWEVDVFHGANEGLVLAEIELAKESISPELPPWLGEEVSADFRFANSSLSKQPYGTF